MGGGGVAKQCVERVCRHRLRLSVYLVCLPSSLPGSTDFASQAAPPNRNGKRLNWLMADYTCWIGWKDFTLPTKETSCRRPLKSPRRPVYGPVRRLPLETGQTTLASRLTTQKTQNLFRCRLRQSPPPLRENGRLLIKSWAYLSLGFYSPPHKR